MPLKTKITVANICGIISFIIGTLLLLVTPLATIFTLIGVVCLYLAGKWAKQQRLEMEQRGISVPIASVQTVRRNLVIVIISIGVMLLITTPLFLYFSPVLQQEGAVYVVGVVVAYAFIVLMLWRKHRRPK